MPARRHVRDGNPPQTNIVHVPDATVSVLMMVLTAGSTSTLYIIAGLKQKVIDVKDALPRAQDRFIGDQSRSSVARSPGVAYEAIIVGLC